jgi:signal transduction histidine kinase
MKHGYAVDVRQHWPVMQTSCLILLGWSLAVVYEMTRKRCAHRMLRGYRQATEAAREKSRLVSQVAHELRTPLSAVLGWTELLLSEAGVDLTASGLDTIGGKLSPCNDERSVNAEMNAIAYDVNALTGAPEHVASTHSAGQINGVASAPPSRRRSTRTPDPPSRTQADFEASRNSSLRLVHMASRHLMCILNDILDVGKLGAGKMVLLDEDFDLHSLAVDTCHIMSGLSARKGLEMILDYPRNVPTLFRGDAGRIRQVLSNLVSNAIKYTEKGYVRVTFREDGLCVNGATYMLCEVEDSGIGVPEELQNKLFVEFSQCGTYSERHAAAGTGLGLFLVSTHTSVCGTFGY